MATDLHWLTSGEAARAIAEKRLSPVELTETLLARIERLNPILGAFIHVDGSGAIEEARKAEAEVMQGRLRGPLHGVPVAIKDIIDCAGMPTTCHSKLFENSIAKEDGPSVARLRQAGAIILGKLSTHEFAVGGPSFDLPWPPARNPWNPDHSPGGSSSGSGAAVAGGLVPMAIGTDTLGSIRHPSGVCGIVGMKPTYGLVPLEGVFPLAASLDHVGPMTRSVADNALMLDIMTGGQGPSYGSEMDLGVRGVKIGFLRSFHEIDMPASPEVAAGLERFAEELSREGAEIHDIGLPDLAMMSAVARAIMHWEAWQTHRNWLSERPQDYGGITRGRLMIGAFLTPEDHVKAKALRRWISAEIQKVLQKVDVLLCASSMDPAARLDEPQEIERTSARQARLPFNLTGNPALATMTGLSQLGLPLPVQLVGRHGEETILYRVAASWERIAGTDAMHPQL